MVFEGREFVPMSAVAHHTPVLTVGGISKRWLVPGWRLGWLILNDPVGVLTDSSFREASVKMMQMLMGPATITQVCSCWECSFSEGRQLALDVDGRSKESFTLADMFAGRQRATRRDLGLSWKFEASFR
jgi:hypothetical protein